MLTELTQARPKVHTQHVLYHWPYGHKRVTSFALGASPPPESSPPPPESVLSGTRQPDITHRKGQEGQGICGQVYPRIELQKIVYPTSIVNRWDSFARGYGVHLVDVPGERLRGIID
jgi:hypothetical protein